MIKAPRLILSAAVLAVAVFAGAHAAVWAADPVVKSLTVDADDHLTVGDRLRLVIKVESDRGTRWALAPGALPPALTLTRTPVATERSLSGNRVETTLIFEVAAFAPGEIVVPPLKLAYQGSSGAGQVETQATRIQVESVLPASANPTPRDLKPQSEVGLAPTSWLLPAVASAVSLVVIVVAFGVWRRRTARPRVETVVEPEPVALGPEDRARAELDRAGIAFAADRDYVVYYSSVAGTVRVYLTERFGFPAFALTTREMQERMVRQGMDRWQARLAGGLLTQCDAVIFAHYRPALERADADLTASYEIVEMSRPGVLEEALV